MRSSDDAQPTGKRSKVVCAAKVLVFLCIAIVLNVLITLALEPYGTAAEVTWHDYRTTTDDIDTIIVGSSFAQRNVDPYVLDEVLGCDSFSLATPAQSFNNALASIQTAHEDHHLTRAIVFVGPESFQTEPWFNAQVTFMQAKVQGEALPQILEDVFRLAFDPVNLKSSKSLTWIFPWFYSTVSFDIDAIKENIYNRLTYPDPIDTAQERLVDPTWNYMGKGHGSYAGLYDRDIKWYHELDLTTAGPFLEKNLSDYTNLLDYCAKEDITCYVGVAPRPEYANLLHAEDGYRSLMMGLEELTVEHGGVYYDFSMTRPEFYRAEEDEYSDGEHLNIDGSAHMTRALGTLIKQTEQGEDVDAYFFAYEEWDTYLMSFDDIEYCYFTYKIDHETGYVKVTAHAIARPDVEQIEYEYEIDNPITGQYVNVRPYDTDPTFYYPMSSGHSDVRLRLSARPVGSTEASRTFHADIFY